MAYCIAKSNESISTIYSGTKDGKILQSQDNGSSWADITPTSITLTGRVELDVYDNDSSIIVAVDAQGKVIKSNTSGTDWVALTAISGFESQGGYNMVQRLCKR